jgi:isoquinoline 1-oxidoreductase
LLTAGSWSAANYDDMRRYSAAGRIARIEAAALHLAVPQDECVAEQGWVIHKPSARRVSYAALIAAGAVNRTFGEADLLKIELKPDHALTLIGTSPPALDIPAKVDGTARFAIDCFMPNLLYAKIARPPLRVGCNPLAVDDAEARKIAGYRRFVAVADPTGDNGHYVMALATGYPAACAAAKALEIAWDKGSNGAVDDAAIVARAKKLVADRDRGVPWWGIGDAAKAMTEAATTFAAEYTTAHVAHAGIEPESALVWRDGERWHAYAGSAFQTHAVAALADALDTDSELISLHQTYLGDPSGQRVETDALVACALAAKAAGQPVKLIFDRDEAMRFDFPRLLTYQRLSGGLDRDGEVTVLQHDLCSNWPLARALPIALQPGADHKTKLDWSVVTGADSWYSVPNYEVRAFKNDLAQRAVPSGFLRGAATGFVFWALGTAVHRDGVLAQIESATLWGLSVALYEQASFANGAFHQENFDTYRMLRFDQVPELDIHIVADGQHPTGAGEPAMSVVAPAIANAIFNAAGARVRDLPITPDRVLAALNKK